MRPLNIWKRSVTVCFNPRICKRCDVVFLVASYPFYGFNPRICKRCDTFTSHLFGWIRVSIHASVKDATFVLLTDKRSKLGFNPRICKRCDCELAGIEIVIHVSIHASVKDATLLTDFCNFILMFQSTHL